LEEFPSFLLKNDELSFFIEELIGVNIGTSDEEMLVDIGSSLPHLNKKGTKIILLKIINFLHGLILICLVYILLLLCIIYHLIKEPSLLNKNQ